MESPEDLSTAEAVGNYFARPATQASSHVGIDPDSECRYVLDGDTAWAAPGANSDGLQLEMAGRAGQSVAQWADGPSLAIIERAAQRTAAWCKAYGLPARHLSDAELGAGQRGIVDHHAVTRVYRQGTHTDVGENFPWAAFMARVVAIMGTPHTTPPPPPTTAGLSVTAWQTLLAFAPVRRDGVWGAETDQRSGWVTTAAQAKAGTLAGSADSTIRLIQRVIGTVEDGKWGDQSRFAITAWTRRAQGLLAVTVTGLWDTPTQAAYARFRTANHH
jgi:hypothetical protein